MVATEGLCPIAAAGVRGVQAVDGVRWRANSWYSIMESRAGGQAKWGFHWDRVSAQCLELACTAACRTGGSIHQEHGGPA